MHAYRFTGSTALIFSDHELGPDTASIGRDGNPPSFDGDVGPLGSTVVLHPGDTLHTPGKVIHSQLEEITTDTDRKAPVRKRRAAATKNVEDKNVPAKNAEQPAGDATPEGE